MKSRKTLKFSILVMATLLSVVSYAEDASRRQKLNFDELDIKVQLFVDTQTDHEQLSDDLLKRAGLSPREIKFYNSKKSTPIASIPKTIEKGGRLTTDATPEAPLEILDTAEWRDLKSTEFKSIRNLELVVENSTAALVGVIPASCESKLKINRSGNKDASLDYDNKIKTDLGKKYVGFQIQVTGDFVSCVEKAKKNKDKEINIYKDDRILDLKVADSETSEVNVCIFSYNKNADNPIAAKKPETICQSLDGKVAKYKPAGLINDEKRKKAETDEAKRVKDLKDAAAGISREKNCATCTVDAKKFENRQAAASELEGLLGDEEISKLRKDIERAAVNELKSKRITTSFENLEELNTEIATAMSQMTDPKNIEELVKLRLDIAKKGIAEAPGATKANDDVAVRLAEELASDLAGSDAKLEKLAKEGLAGLKNRAATMAQIRPTLDIANQADFANNPMTQQAFFANYMANYPAIKAQAQMECATNSASPKCQAAQLAAQHFETALSSAQTKIKQRQEQARIQEQAQRNLQQNLQQLMGGSNSPSSNVGFAAQQGTNNIQMQQMQNQLMPTMPNQFGPQYSMNQPYMNQFGGNQFSGNPGFLR